MNDRVKHILELDSARLQVLLQHARQKNLRHMIPTSSHREKTGTFPQSFAQQRLWFLDQLLGNAAYHIPMFIRLTGVLNPDVLEHSLNEIVRRHEVLRTTFGSVDGQPVQIINPALTLTLPVIDLCGFPEIERETIARDLSTEYAQQPFHLDRGPLLRAILLRLDENEHRLLLSLHHIVADEWAGDVFTRELALLYGAFSKQMPSPLAELPVQYADFAVWQRQRLQGEEFEKHILYWKQQLGNDPPMLRLPTDRPRPAMASFRGGSHSFVISKPLTKALKVLSQRERVTLFMLLLTAFKVMLRRYTGQEDIAVGSPIINRNRTEIEGLIGLFINMLVLRTDTSGNPTFQELLGRVREVVLGAYAHQDLPFERLVEELQPERVLSQNPLFQVVFAFHDASIPSLELSGLTLNLLALDTQMARFDLEFHLRKDSDGLRGVLLYSADLFDATTIARMARHFQTLLEGIAAHPNQRLSELPLLAEAERRQLLVEWNDTKVECPQSLCAHELFETQAEETPDAVAVVFEEQHITYRELNGRANQLAHYLQRMGIKPETLVGICVERSLEMVVGLLGILKAGGAYVPLDPMYPRDRSAFVLEDTKSPVLLMQSHLSNLLPEYRGRILYLDADWSVVAEESGQNLPHKALANNLVYVIYTSGSTGKPKGVQIPHCALTNLLNFMRQRLWLNQDTLVAVTTISFDIAGLELYLPLITGNRLVLVNRKVASDGNRLLGSIREYGATVMQATPATWQLLLASGWEGNEGLTMLCGAEPLPHALADQLLERGASLWNLYGPTETTIWSTIHPVGPGEDPISIGRPLANTQLYILDAHLQPVPVGVPGELYIGGEGLARGYLWQPAMTAEKFIPHPFADEAGARLYKTGDLACYVSGGNVEFLGRIDHQVKVRGFRVELGEIEEVIGSHPGVRETVVVAREDGLVDLSNKVGAGKQLVAYVVPKGEQVFRADDMRRFLREKLPDYMVPSAFVAIETLPLTSNGKVDRKALPVPERADFLAASFVTPRTPMEEVLAGMWAQVLGIEQVGATDNFFGLGGHSLLATQVVSRVREIFEVELPLRVLFESPTIAELARCIEKARWSKQDLVMPPLVPVGREGKLALSFAQQRLWFLDQLMPGNPFYNIPTAMHLTGQLDIATLMRAFYEIVNRHEILRTTFMAVNGQAIQVIAPASAVKLPVVDLCQLSDGEREVEARRLASEEAQHPFDLACGPLMRVTLLKLDAEEYVLLLTMPHIIFDGWSWGVLAREIAALYRDFSTDTTLSLPPLPIQYADFAAWQRKWMQGETLEKQLAYWAKQLEGMPKVLELPGDRPCPPTLTFQGASEPCTISKALTEALKALSQREGATLFMTLLAAFQALLCRYTGQEDVAVGTPIANRNRVEVEGLIGFFVNTLVLRTDLSGNPTFHELLGRVREMVLAAYAHQDLPFEMLVQRLRPERGSSHNPLVQVALMLQNAPMESFEWPGLTVRPLEFETKVSRGALEFQLREGPEGLRGHLLYNTDIFEPATIAQILDHFENLLKEISAHPEWRLFEIPLLKDGRNSPLKEAGPHVMDPGRFGFETIGKDEIARVLTNPC